MLNLKNNEDKTIKGSVSHTLGDRKYFGTSTGNIFEKNNGYYGNVHQNIFGKFK